MAQTGLKQALVRTLMRAWTQRGPIALLLLPLGGLYYGLHALRRTLYGAGLLVSQRVDGAVVMVVGNAIAGGAGKTPTTIGIVQHLQARGLAVGVVSRGQGRSHNAVQAVTPQSDVYSAGDEPLLIARATGVPVFVAAKRYEAAVALLAAHPQTRVIVCDDGLQHYALHRDIEVCVFDERGVGNGWPLPAGPLREPWPRTALACAGQRDDRLLVLHTGAQTAFSGYRAHRSLARQAIALDGVAIPLGTLSPPLLALAGIARPDRFFTCLRDTGLVLDKTLALPDHFDFSQVDTEALRGYQVLCTEKDAVKLWRYLPQALAVPLNQVLEPAFLAALDALVDQVLAAKLSSDHGHQIA